MSKFTYDLDGMGWIRLEVFKNLIKFKFTYFLPVEWDKKIG